MNIVCTKETLFYQQKNKTLKIDSFNIVFFNIKYINVNIYLTLTDI